MISKKQQKILAFSYTGFDALICDGAIRSGKTSLMTVAFVDWAMREFDRCNFAICGKTVGSARRNIISPYMAMSYVREKYDVKFSYSQNFMTVKQGDKENYFYLFGGKDESSYMLIQGLTLAGVLLDEVALLTRSFVEQALARCSINNSKYWFNCNPASPQHWFYLEWILKADEKNALHLHFDLRDNPALTDKIIERYENTYSGVFYDRYILGLWVQAEGLIYPEQARGKNVVQTLPNGFDLYVVSMDYGTLNPCSMGLWGRNNGRWYRIREYYYSGRNGTLKTDEEYYQELEKLTADLPIYCVVIDPSAASFIACVRRHGRYSVKRADNSVLDGIRNTANAFKQDKIFIWGGCKDCIREFGLYSWDEKAETDKPIKENDHAMDDMRYFVQTILKRGL